MNTDAQFVLSDALAELRRSGCRNATGWRLNQLIQDGRLPRPEKRSDGRLAYTRPFLEQAREILIGLPSNRAPKQPA